MTRVTVTKRIRISTRGDPAVETWFLVDADTGQEITHGSKEEIHLRAARVREIHERHAKEAAE